MKGDVSMMAKEEEERGYEELWKEWGYETPCLIGSGAFAKVYRVRECASGRQVACKVSLSVRLLFQEAALLGQIDHSLFPRFYDFKEWRGVGFLWMEYIPGTDLETFVRQRGRLPQRQAARIGTALAEGICYLHEQTVPIIFRDLKPQNVMLGEGGEVKLVDLGSAVRMDGAQGSIAGTRGYAAPEQWKCTEEVGCYSDVYALGRVMYFMLGDGNIQRGLRMLLEECVKQDIRERISGMRCLLRELRPYASGNPYWMHKKKCEYIFQQDVIKI